MFVSCFRVTHPNISSRRVTLFGPVSFYNQNNNNNNKENGSFKGGNQPFNTPPAQPHGERHHPNKSTGWYEGLFGWPPTPNGSSPMKTSPVRGRAAAFSPSFAAAFDPSFAAPPKVAAAPASAPVMVDLLDFGASEPASAPAPSAPAPSPPAPSPPAPAAGHDPIAAPTPTLADGWPLLLEEEIEEFETQKQKVDEERDVASARADNNEGLVKTDGKTAKEKKKKSVAIAQKSVTLRKELDDSNKNAAAISNRKKQHSKKKKGRVVHRPVQKKDTIAKQIANHRDRLLQKVDMEPKEILQKDFNDRLGIDSIAIMFGCETKSKMGTISRPTQVNLMKLLEAVDLRQHEDFRQRINSNYLLQDCFRDTENVQLKLASVENYKHFWNLSNKNIKIKNTDHDTNVLRLQALFYGN